jgi:hypothetical protein
MCSPQPQRTLGEAGIQADLFLCGTVMIDVENDSGILLFVLRGETLL